MIVLSPWVIKPFEIIMFLESMELKACMIIYRKKHLILIVSTLYAFVMPQPVFACMPLSANDVFIARIVSSQTKAVADSASRYDIKMEHSSFPFRTIKTLFTYSKPHQWQSNFKTSNIGANSLVIGLAYTPDEHKSHFYSVTTLSLLDCKNDTLIIGKPVVSFIAWDREKGNCRRESSNNIALLDGFIAHDQAYYLQKLQAKYPTCDSLYSKFPLKNTAYQLFWTHIHNIFLHINNWFRNILS